MLRTFFWILLRILSLHQNLLRITRNSDVYVFFLGGPFFPTFHRNSFSSTSPESGLWDSGETNPDKKYLALIRWILPSPTHDPQEKLLKVDLLKLKQFRNLVKPFKVRKNIGNLIFYVPIRTMGLVDLPTFSIKIKHMQVHMPYMDPIGYIRDKFQVPS